MEKEVLTVSETAEYLQVSRAQVYVFMNRQVNPLPYVQISDSTRRVRKQDIIDWMARDVVGGQQA
jgi:excisionase family DNA binding protein